MSGDIHGIQKSGLGILFPIVLIGVAGFFLPPLLGMHAGRGLVMTWLVIAILMLIIIGIIGKSLNKGWHGILIDNRNMISLSRLQMMLWTVVLLSAFMTVALARVSDSRLNPDGYNVTACTSGTTENQTEQEPKCADPLGIQLPELLWALMGISITSGVMSPLLKANKAGSTADKARASPPQKKLYNKILCRHQQEIRKDEILKRDGVLENNTKPEYVFKRDGVLVKKTKPEFAKFSDVFMGEEISNFTYVDVAKVQNFFFTMISVIAYTVALAVAMSTTSSIAEFFKFPDIPAGLVAVISISHGGYLTDKAFTRTTG